MPGYFYCTRKKLDYDRYWFHVTKSFIEYNATTSKTINEFLIVFSLRCIISAFVIKWCAIFEHRNSAYKLDKTM